MTLEEQLEEHRARAVDALCALWGISIRQAERIVEWGELHAAGVLWLLMRIDGEETDGQ